MRLFYSPASPFARKCLVAAHELGLQDRVEVVPASLTPVSRNAEVAAKNPLGKVPTLVLDDGAALYDSRVIVDYIETLAGGGRLTPPGGLARADALTRQALGDGIMDAAILARYEATLRPEPMRWADWTEGQLVKIDAALDAMEATPPGSTFDVGAIAQACALGYLDFRFAERRWRDGRPALAAWFERVAARPSFIATVPR